MIKCNIFGVYIPIYEEKKLTTNVETELANNN